MDRVSCIIHETRLRKKLTITELSELSGLSERTVWAVDMGESEPRFFTVTCIAQALGLSLDYLAWGKGEKNVET